MTLTDLTVKLRFQVRALDDLAGGMEALVLALTTRAAGWVACIPTIALTARSCEMLFEIAPAMAVASAVSLELVGQSVTANWLRAREWNKAKGVKSPPASEWLALAMVVGYFATDFLLVGALQAPKALIEPVYWTALLFPLAQVISTLTTGQRAAQFRREANAEAISAKRSAIAKNAVAKRAQRKAATSEMQAQAAIIPIVSGNGKKHACPYCGATAGQDGKPFANSQAVSAHLRRCEMYQAQKAQKVQVETVCS